MANNVPNGVNQFPQSIAAGVKIPAGAELGEDSGDLVIRDNSGTVIFRYDEGTDEWQLDDDLALEGTLTEGASL